MREYVILHEITREYAWYNSYLSGELGASVHGGGDWWRGAGESGGSDGGCVWERIEQTQWSGHLLHAAQLSFLLGVGEFHNEAAAGSLERKWAVVLMVGVTWGWG